MNVKLKLEDKGWQDYIRGLVKVLSAPDEYLKKAFLIIWEKEAASHFDNEEGPSGAWAPWSPSYAAYMDRIGQGGNKILQRSGEMKKRTLKDPEIVRSRRGLEVFSPIEYSGWLDEGNESGTLPPRPFMWLGDDAQERMANVLGEMLYGGDR